MPVFVVNYFHLNVGINVDTQFKTQINTKKNKKIYLYIGNIKKKLYLYIENIKIYSIYRI